MPGRIRLIALCLAITRAVCAQTSVSPIASAANAPTPDTFRSGEPVSFSGRVLPTDATGTLTLIVDNVPVQTVPVSTLPQIDTIAFGDDIPYAGYIADPTQRYPAQLAQSLSASAISLANIGTTACDLMPLEVLPNNIVSTPTTSPLYSVLVGTNDITLFGTGAHEAVFNLCHQAALAWIGILRANKLLIGDANITIESGSWSPIAAPTSCCLSALNNTTGNGILRFTLTTEGTAYLWYVIDPNTAGSFTVSVDGGSASTAIQTQQPIAAISYGVLRLANTAGSHTFDVTAQSGSITILGIGSARSSAAPIVLAADIPNQIGGNASAIAAYTADIQSNIALLQADGLDVRFVPTQQFMFASPAEMIDATHPNAVGLSEIAQAFEAVATPPPPTIEASAGYTARTLPIGPHTLDITYSGDTKYPPAYAATISIAVYDGTSSTTLISDAPVYPAQSPVIFTASVPQPNASGQAIFTDETGPLGSAWLNEPTGGQAQLTLPSLPIGVHLVTAQYLGDITYNPSASAPITVNVSGTYTATSLTAPATRFLAATPVPLIATVIPASANGTITFQDGSSTLAQATLVAGAATFTTPLLATGIHNLTAAFSGNSTQDASASPILAVEIDLNATGLTLLANPTTASYGTPITISAALQPIAATGIITLIDGTQALAQATIANGFATFTLSSLTPGSHTLTGLYSGDSSDLPSSATVALQISRAPSATTLVPSSTTSAFSSPIAFATHIQPKSATGNIALFDGNTVVAQGPVAGGIGNFTIATLAPGIHSITAAYSGDALDLPSISDLSSITITPSLAKVMLTPLPATIDAGNAMALTTAIVPTTATGTVLFRDATLGVLGQSTVIHGTAVLTLANPTVGSYTIAAIYSGDTDDSSATSAPVTTQVIPNPTTISLAASPASAVVDSPVTLNAMVVPATAGGEVTFLDGTTPLGVSLVIHGTGTFITTSLSPGNHSLHATYSGDSLHSPSTSTPIAETITLATSTMGLTLAQNPIVASGEIIANVAVASSASNPTGSVSIRSGSILLATGTLANASSGFAYTTLAFSAATLGLGQFPLTASYFGDIDNQPSAASANITVEAIPTTTSLILSTAQIAIQGSVTLTATVTPTATGTITILSNGVPVATALASPAVFTFTPTSIGTYSLTATFTPSGLYAASTSSTEFLVITPPVSATLAPTSVNAGPGTASTAILTVTPLSGFSGPVVAICSTPVTFITCSVTVPATISAAIMTPVQIKIATTTTATLALPGSRNLIHVALAIFLPLLILRRPRRNIVPIAFVVATLWIAGCAEGGDFNSIPSGPETITVTITAANTPVTTTLTVNVLD